MLSIFGNDLQLGNALESRHINIISAHSAVSASVCHEPKVRAVSGTRCGEKRREEGRGCWLTVSIVIYMYVYVYVKPQNNAHIALFVLFSCRVVFFFRLHCKG